MSANSLRVLHKAAITFDKADLPCRQHPMSWGPPCRPSDLKEAVVDLEFGTIHVRVADADSTASLWTSTHSLGVPSARDVATAIATNE